MTTRTLHWIHISPVEGLVPVTLEWVDGQLSLTKNGVPLDLTSQEGETMLRELSVLIGSTGPA